MERLRDFLRRPLGWVVFQIVLLFLVVSLARVAAALFGDDALVASLIVLAVVASVASYLVRRRFLGSTGWGFEDDRADRRRPPGG